MWGSILEGEAYSLKGDVEGIDYGICFCSLAVGLTGTDPFTPN